MYDARTANGACIGGALEFLLPIEGLTNEVMSFITIRIDLRICLQKKYLARYIQLQLIMTYDHY